ncbi:MAG: hypothetical protein HGA54_02455, partial [Actinobacteria bacterium]|nr:hypothetical protein [Actinomycetota bacterium]
LEQARLEQDVFVNKLRVAADEAFEQMEAEGIEGVVLACHSYHVDPGLSHGIDTLLNTLGFEVFSPLSLSHRIPERPLPDACANEWYQPSQLYDICQYVAENDKLELVHLYSFGCGVDPLAIETARRILRSKGKLYTGLKLGDSGNYPHPSAFTTRCARQA